MYSLSPLILALSINFFRNGRPSWKLTCIYWEFLRAILYLANLFDSKYLNEYIELFGRVQGQCVYWIFQESILHLHGFWTILQMLISWWRQSPISSCFGVDSHNQAIFSSSRRDHSTFKNHQDSKKNLFLQQPNW